MHLADADLRGWHAYVVSLYWSTQTLFRIGYGDLPPVTLGEHVFVTFTCMVAAVLLSHTLGTISVLHAELNTKGALYRAKIAQIARFCEIHALPPSIHSRVRDYFDFRQATAAYVNEEELFANLSPSLRIDAILSMNDQALLRNQVLRNLGHGALRALVRELKPQSCGSGDVIIREGDASITMFFIMSGTVSVSASKKVLTTLGPGEFVGEIGLLKSIMATATVRAATACDLFSISAPALDKVFLRYACFAVPRAVWDAVQCMLCKQVSRRKEGVHAGGRGPPSRQRAVAHGPPFPSHHKGFTLALLLRAVGADRFGSLVSRLQQERVSDPSAQSVATVVGLVHGSHLAGARNYDTI